ncbi:MAG: NADH-quinone oxidoreductase subunit NuoE [Acetobacteraceae bacterium]|nr:NADH-quinone oxidoreductase subunit NuoE [Acetobacteraceae bacterium]
MRGEPVEDSGKLGALLDRYRGQPGALIPLLQDIQREMGYLPRPALEEAARALGLPAVKVYGVATFYAQFHLKPRGRHVCRVCLGTACHVRGGERILSRVSADLGIAPGDTTPDRAFTLERVACLGACGLSPAMMVDDQTFGRLTPDKASRLLRRFAREAPDGGGGGGRTAE